MTEYIPDTAAAPPDVDPARGALKRGQADELRQEAEATISRSEKAALLFDAGTVSEFALDRPAQAAQDYLGAYNADARLSHALLSLLRLFERRISKKNLERLYEAALRNARTAEEKSAALVDLACLDLLQEHDLDGASMRLSRALELTEAPDAALLQEYVQQRRVPNDEHAVVMRRAAVCDDPLERGALLLEAAARDELLGEPARALEKLNSAVEGAPRFEPFAVALEKLARRHGFVPELLSACEARAEMIVNELLREPSGSTVETESQDALITRAVALWVESARLRASVLDDPTRAVTSLDRALALRTDDPLALTARMLAHELAGEREKCAADAQRLLALGASGDFAAALQFRLSDAARARGDLAGAQHHLLECIAQTRSTVAADTLLDDLLIDQGEHGERIARREARAHAATPERAGRLWLEAARIAAFDLQDAARAKELLERALERGPNHHETLQEAYGAALVLGSDELAELVLPKLLHDEQDADQRAALVHHRLELLADGAEARELLRSELKRETQSPALLPLARVRAAEGKDFALLAEAHLLLAHRRPPNEADAHRIAAARAWARSGDFAAALSSIEGLSSAARSQHYVLGLLEEVLTRLGRKDELTAFLQSSAESDATTVAEDALLLAAARAELKSGEEQAERSYRATLDIHPHSRAALLALLEAQFGHEYGSEAQALLDQLAEVTGAEPREQAVYTLLAEELREQLTPKERPSESAISRLLAAEAPEEATAFLLTSPAVDELTREAALDLLETRLDETERAALARESGGRAVAHGGAPAVVYETVERIREFAPNDAWAVWTRTVVPLPHDEQGHVEALVELAHLSGSRAIEQATTAEILWVRRLDGTGALAADMPAPLSEDRGAGLFTHVLASAHPVRDNELLARAYDGAVTLGLTSDPLEAKLGGARAHLAGGRLPEARRLIDAVLAEEPDHPTALELALAQARAAGDHQRLADVAEQLAYLLGDGLAVELLEESALVRRNELDDAGGEERALKEVLARAPTRASAYGLLHELYAERGNTDALIALVEKRTEMLDDPEELVRCFYELARLHRGRGELSAALDAIDSVLMLEEHVGALALAAEIHTTQENYADAVSALASLAAAAGTPASQRKLARLGAADFLEHRLGDLAAAAVQLELLVAEAPDDAHAWRKLAELSERTGKLERAVSALLSARAHEQADAQRELTLRAARMLTDQLNRGDEAVPLYRELLDRHPDEREAAFALHRLTGDTHALALYEAELAKNLEARPSDVTLLRELARAGARAEHRDAEWTALSALVGLNEATASEAERATELSRSLDGRPMAQRTLSAGELASLREPALLAPYRELIASVGEHADLIDQLTLVRFGVGKNERAAGKNAHELRALAEGMSHALGVTLGDIYIGGDDLTRIAAVPEERTLHLVFGLGVSSSLSPQRRYRLALQVAGHALRSLPLLTRGDEQAERLLVSALVASEISLPEALTREPLLNLPRTLARVLPRRTRKALLDLYRSLPDGGRTLRAQSGAALHEVRALALALAPDLPAALDEVLGMLPPADTVHASQAAQSMLRTWISPAFRTLRSKLELTL